MVSHPTEAPADLAWGAFSDSPPWVLDLNDITWCAVVPSQRERVRAELPGLIAPGGMPPGARFLRVTGRLSAALAPWYVRKRAGRYADASQRRADLSRRLRRAAERLGPTYIKLGQ